MVQLGDANIVALGPSFLSAPAFRGVGRLLDAESYYVFSF